MGEKTREATGGRLAALDGLRGHRRGGRPAAPCHVHERRLPRNSGRRIGPDRFGDVVDQLHAAEAVHRRCRVGDRVLRAVRPGGRPFRSSGSADSTGSPTSRAVPCASWCRWWPPCCSRPSGSWRSRRSRRSPTATWLSNSSTPNFGWEYIVKGWDLLGGDGQINNPLWSLRWELVFSLALPIFAVAGARRAQVVDRRPGRRVRASPTWASTPVRVSCSTCPRSSSAR